MDSADRDMSLHVRGTRGELLVPKFPVPHEDDTLMLRRPGAEDVVEHLGTRTSYTFQLEAFADAVRNGAPVLTNAAWSLANMELVDAAYVAAGMSTRTAARAAG